MTVKDEERYDVFLGGSCGGRKSPTSWRKEVAIPLLLKNSIKFYNPQVDTWTNDLVHKENDAKDKSDWLLFVLEMSTRGIASMVEVAYLVGLGRSVVFVLQKDRKHGKFKIPDDHVSNEELEDITRSQSVLTAMVSRHSACKYCNVLKSGLKHVIRSLKQGTVCPNAASCNDFRKAAASVRSYVSKAAAGMVRSLLTAGWAVADDMPGPSRQKRYRHATGQSAMTFPVAVDFKQQQQQDVLQPSPASSILRRVGVIGSLLPAAEDQLKNRGFEVIVDPCTDGGSKKATPIGDSMTRLLACSVLLIVITSDSLACTAMCKAAYCITQHKNAILCVQDIPEKSAAAAAASTASVQDGLTITVGALRDYNRGRAYLRDVGQRQGAFVCDDLDMALHKVCTKADVRT